MKCLDCGHDLTMDEAEEHREMGHTVKSGFFEGGTMNWQETLVTNKEINDYHKAIFPWMYQGNDEDWCEEQLHRLIALSETSDGKFLLEAQAKATWEAREPEIAEAERRGVRKVVEFCKQKIFNTFIDRDTGEPYLAFRDNADKEWQAFLKGIEGESRQELPK